MDFCIVDSFSNMFHPRKIEAVVANSGVIGSDGSCVFSLRSLHIIASKFYFCSHDSEIFTVLVKKKKLISSLQSKALFSLNIEIRCCLTYIMFAIDRNSHCKQECPR